MTKKLLFEKTNLCMVKFRCPIELGKQILECKFFAQNILGFCAYFDRDKKRSCINREANSVALDKLISVIKEQS